MKIIQNCQKENTAKKTVFVGGGRRGANFAIWRRNIKKNPDQTPHQTTPLFFSPKQRVLTFGGWEDESAPFFFSASPSSSPLLQNRSSSSLSLPPSLPLSVCVSLSFPSHLLLFVATKVCSFITVRREQIFLHVDSSFIR